MQPTTSTDTHDEVVAGSSTLALLRAEAVVAPPRALDPATYARDHALFEARSDQRALIAAWLRERLILRDPDEPLSVLSAGCGDGALDVVLADALTRDRDRWVGYVGVEPFAGSAKLFEARLRGLERPRLSVAVHVAPFHEAPLKETFDVVTFVHSMYYVPDVAETVRAAYDLLRPGGELLVLSAPRGELNQVAGAIAPEVQGHRQWFSDDVCSGFVLAGFDVDEKVTLDASVDLSGASDGVLDFTVQARLTPTLRPMVLDYLAQVAPPGDVLRLPHPVDAYRITRPH